MQSGWVHLGWWGGFTSKLHLVCHLVTPAVPDLAGEKGEQGLSLCPVAPHDAALVKSLF